MVRLARASFQTHSLRTLSLISIRSRPIPPLATKMKSSLSSPTQITMPSICPPGLSAEESISHSLPERSFPETAVSTSHRVFVTSARVVPARPEVKEILSSGTTRATSPTSPRHSPCLTPPAPWLPRPPLRTCPATPSSFSSLAKSCITRPMVRASNSSNSST